MSAEPIDKGVTTRMPAVALLCVNSSDQEIFDKTNGLRITSSTPAKIYINNQQPALFGYMTRLALTEVSMEWDVPNVNQYNNTLTIGVYQVASPDVLFDVVRISIPVGFYTGPRLGAVIMNTLNANPTLTTHFGTDTFGVIYGGLNCGIHLPFAGTTQQTTFADYTIDTSSTLMRFALLPYSKKFATGLPALQDDLTNMMGLTPTKTSLISYTNIQGGYASLQYTPYVDIVSNLLTKNQNIRDGTSSKSQKTSSILARIYLANENFIARQATATYDASGIMIRSTDNAVGTSVGTLRREFVYPKQIAWNNTENVDVIDLEVVDAKGNPLFYQPVATSLGADTVQIHNTADFFFTLQATEN